jgi:hypothetical protein
MDWSGNKRQIFRKTQTVSRPAVDQPCKNRRIFQECGGVKKKEMSAEKPRKKTKTCAQRLLETFRELSPENQVALLDYTRAAQRNGKTKREKKQGRNK